MKKIIIPALIILIPTLVCATGVVYKTSTNDLVAIGNITLSQFAGSDITTVELSEGKIAKASSLRQLIFNPATQSVDLRPQVELDQIKNRQDLEQDVLQIIILRSYFVSGTQLGNQVSSQALKDEIAIATNTIMAQINQVIARH